jgi:hypothetical protein
LPARTKVVERAQHLLDRRHGVEGMQLQQVDGVGAQAPERGIDALDQMMARGADIVRSVPRAQRELGRQDDLVAPAPDGRAEYRFGSAARVDVGAVEQVDAGVETDVDDAARTRDIGVAPGAEQRAFAAEGAGAEAEGRDLEARVAQIAVFHGVSLSA